MNSGKNASSRWMTWRAGAFVLAVLSVIAFGSSCGDMSEGELDVTHTHGESGELLQQEHELVSSCKKRRVDAYQRGNRFRITTVKVDGKPVELNSGSAFIKMQKAARRAGVNLRVVSGFRSMSEQRYLYNCYRTGRCNGGNLAARPGYSNHQSGHAFDINTATPGVLSWLNRNASRYGFHRTVPSENWHWEYWGPKVSPQICSKRYRSKLWVTLARHADDRLKDGESKGVADVFEFQKPKGYIYFKNESNRTLKNVYLKYDYTKDYLHARKYLIQRRKKGQQRWRTSGMLHGDDRNPAKDKFGSKSTLFLGDLKPGEYRRIVIYFKATQYSLHKKHDVRLRAWLRTISDGVYRGGRTYGTKPTRNKFKRRKRDQATIDILAKEEWRFDGPTHRDTEGWRSCNNTSTGPERIYKRTRRNGALVVEVRGSNGCVKSPRWTKINADGYDELVLRVKSKHGPHKMAVYFNTRRDQRWSSSRGVIVDVIGDGEWQMMVIPMAAHPQWKGIIRRIRIDPLEGQGPRTGDIEKHQIDKVFLQRSDQRKTSSPRQDYLTRTPVPVELSL